MAGERTRILARAYLCGRDLKPDDVKRKVASSARGALVQTAAAGSASNEFFVEMLAAQTLRAESTGSLLARRPEIDFLLRLAGTTQISRAITEQGAVDGEPFIVVIAGGERRGGTRGAVGKELPRRRLSDMELQRVEAAALLSAQRA